jgi:tetratricopeptide (TPR) repeat protein
MNANDQYAREIFDEYNCQGVPHLLFVDKNGKEVDRIIGYLPPSEYLLRIKDIKNNKHTLNDYLTQYNDGLNNADLIAEIASKYEQRGDMENAKEFYSIIIKEYPDLLSDHYKKATYFIASNAFRTGVDMALKAYILSFPDSPYIMDAYYSMLGYYSEKEMKNKELEIFSQLIQQFSEDANVLNQYAWRMTELDEKLEDALEKARKAVVLTVDNPQSQAMILDTEAEVLWKLERFDEAIEVIERAISIDSKNQYYKDQKKKFLNSKQTKDTVHIIHESLSCNFYC